MPLLFFVRINRFVSIFKKSEINVARYLRNQTIAHRNTFHFTRMCRWQISCNLIFLQKNISKKTLAKREICEKWTFALNWRLRTTASVSFRKCLVSQVFRIPKVKLSTNWSLYQQELLYLRIRELSSASSWQKLQTNSRNYLQCNNRQKISLNLEVDFSDSHHNRNFALHLRRGFEYRKRRTEKCLFWWFASCHFARFWRNHFCVSGKNKKKFEGWTKGIGRLDYFRLLN